MSKTVKAREHHGAESLNLTIPTKIVKDYKINAGDVFQITVETIKDKVILQYRRVHARS